MKLPPFLCNFEPFTNANLELRKAGKEGGAARFPEFLSSKLNRKFLPGMIRRAPGAGLI